VTQEYRLPGVGRVRYRVQKIPHFCGGAVVFAVQFHVNSPAYINRKAQLYDGFNEHLRTAHYNMDIDRCKLIMCDSVNDGGTHGTIYEFCSHAGWWVGPATHNRKSGNDVVIFELEREVISHPN
jgi:hypothetical protein